MRRRSWGAVRRLPSGRYQARYSVGEVTHTAPFTFDTKGDADEWLAGTRTDIIRGVWVDPNAAEPVPVPTFAEYSVDWLGDRQLKPRSRHGYSRLIANNLTPTFGKCLLTDITSASVRKWYSDFAGSPSVRTAAYSVFRAIMRTAASDELIDASPVKVRGASANPRQSETKRITDAELAVMREAMSEPLKLTIGLSVGCGVRQGELIGLTRADIDLKKKTIRVARAIGRTPGEIHIGTPKTRAGHRTIHYPPNLATEIAAHLAKHVGPEPDALLFPSPTGGYMNPSHLIYWWRIARVAAGRPDARWHDLRHESASRFGEAGATLAELMARFGWEDSRVAVRYMHAASDRDRALAAKLA